MANFWDALDGLATKTLEYKTAEAAADAASADEWRKLAEKAVENSTNGQQSGEQPSAHINPAYVIAGGAASLGLLAYLLLR